MTNKRHKVTKIKCKRRESTGKESLFVELNFAVARSQKNSKHRPGETQLEQIYIWLSDLFCRPCFTSSLWHSGGKIADVFRETTLAARYDERRLHSIAVAYGTSRKESFDRTCFFCFVFLQNFDHLFKVNEKKAGGSFYLQSKVSMCTQQNQMKKRKS